MPHKLPESRADIYRSKEYGKGVPLKSQAKKNQPHGTDSLKLERETRLELATPTLARLCSTN